MLPIRYKNGAFPTNGVLAKADLASLEGTPLDPRVEEWGAFIRLPVKCLDWQNREIDRLWLPPLPAIREGDIFVLNPIQGSAQSLLVAIEKFKTKEFEQPQLARAVISYQNTALQQLFGRSGMISKFVMSSRMKRSGRAVLLPRAGGNPLYCELPEWMMKALKLSDGDYVLVGRDPTIWEGGIEVLRVRGCKENVIRLHPLVFAQLNADCVAEGTPILLRHNVNSHHHISDINDMSTTNIIIGKTGSLPIEYLSPNEEGQVRSVFDFETPDRTGIWVPVTMSMNKGKKKTIDITTRYGGTIRVTPDHKVSSRGVWKEAREIKVGDVLDLGDVQPFEMDEPSKADLEMAWALGIFCADGFAGSYFRNRNPQDTRYEFRLTNNNTSLLERAKIGLSQYGVSFEIQQYDSEKPGAEHRFPTDKHISHLVVSGVKRGQKKDFVLKLLDECYTKPQGRWKKREKKVPPIVLSSPALAKAWLDGFFAGDGRHLSSQEIPEESAEFTISSRSILMAFPVVAKMAGYDITIRRCIDRDAFSVRLRSGSRSARKDNEVIEIVDSGEHVVYDITTQGEFLAGMNVVHNCDGDQVWVLAIPSRLKHEAKAQLGSFMKRTAKWPKPYNLEGEEVDWERVEFDMSYRAAPTGFSVSPEDVLTDGSNLERVEEITGKELKGECRKTALGLSYEEWKAITLEVNDAQLKMKVGMSPVGAAAMAVRILAGDNPRTRRAASLISERIEQKLLDSKRAKDSGDKYQHTTALDILQMRNEWLDSDENEATEGLATCLGLKNSDVRPIIREIWSRGQGLSAIMRDEFPLFASTTQVAENRDQAVLLAKTLFIDKKAERDSLGRLVINILGVKETADVVEA